MRLDGNHAGQKTQANPITWFVVFPFQNSLSREIICVFLIEISLYTKTCQTKTWQIGNTNRDLSPIVVVTHPSIKIDKQFMKDVYKSSPSLNGWIINVKVDGKFSRYGLGNVVIIVSFVKKISVTDNWTSF